MIEPLRPMSTGQLLDHTFALYRKNFLLFVGIASLGPAANVVFQLLTVGANVGSPFAPFGRRGVATGAAASMGLSMLVGYVIMLAGMALAHAATVKAVAAVHLGLETSIIAAYKALRGRIWSVFGTFALIALIVGSATAGFVFVAVMVAMVPAIVLRSGTPGAAGAAIIGIVVIVAALLAFAVFIALYVRYAVAIQACIVEGLGPRASLKRSVLLTKGGRWRVVAIYLIFMLLGVILGGGLGALAGAAGGLLHNIIAAAVLVYLAGFVAGSIAGPLSTIGLSLLYYDERVRKEAFDLQLMLSSLDAPVAPLAVPAQI
jgi:hypothetical protein